MTHTYTVLLENGTTGTVSTDTLNGQHPETYMGEIINVHSYDENGQAIEQQGKLIEVLD